MAERVGLAKTGFGLFQKNRFIATALPEPDLK